MKKNQIRHLVIHNAENTDHNALADKVSAFHVQVIERRLNQFPLTAEQKIVIIDKIIETLKSREAEGFEAVSL